jgi:dihydrofolate reductase
MRKVILSNSVTLDGFFEGPNKELDWHIVDEEVKEYAKDLLNNVDTLLFGRVTYQLMADYWPAAATNSSTSKSDLEIADKMNNLPKIVFSKTLQEVKWNNSSLFKENIVEELPFGLIDEYRIILNPVVLGNGNPLFKGINEKQNLKLLKTRMFSSGVVILFYEPVKTSS